MPNDDDIDDVSDVLRSPTLGTGLSSLGRPCGDALRPDTPPDPGSGLTFGMTFSGGGFRATLPALGMVRFLADAGLLSNLRYVSSVSGGSVANGILAVKWPKIRAAGYSSAAVDAEIIDPIVKKISSRSLKRKLILNIWRIVGSKNRTELLADAFDDWWFDGHELEHLDPEVRWIINAANTRTGVRFGFERDVLGDYVVGLASTAGTGVRVATAAAASAAVPGAFAKLTLPEDIAFPCGDTRGRPTLLDGGVYDNTGLEALDSERYHDVFTITMNAGGVLTVASGGGLPIVGDLMRSNSLLYRQSTSLRTRWMVERFERDRAAREAGETPGRDARRGVLVALATDFESDGGPLDAFRARYPEHRNWDGKDLAFVPTVFDQLDEELCRALIHRGWWLAAAGMARYHSDDIPLPDLGDGPPL
ncbi:MAG: patatin-like phospholipase family protein [Actinomycetota bacterium]